MSSDSLKKRYFFKLSTNFIGLLISIVTAGIIPRALGVRNYGNFNFATSIVNEILNFFDLRTSTCFYTRLSQRQKENSLLIFYSYYSIAIILLLILTITVINMTPLKMLIFANLSISIIYYALIYTILSWSLNILVYIMDANGATVPLERMRIINKIISAVIILILYFYKLLDLTTYFYYSYGILLLLIIPIFIYIRRRIGYNLKIYPFLKKDITSSYIKEFYSYSSPLAIYAIFSLISAAFDRWILQIYAGSYQQGLYSFSFTLTNFCFIFITALIPLFTRELSIAASTNNIMEMATLFRRYVPMLYAIMAFFCCFIFVEIDNVIKLFGGNEYLNAKLSMSILAFYPLVSTYSNLSGSVIYATGRTKIFFKLTLIFTPIGMLLTYFLISNNNFGLNIGALGLAIKNISLELVSVVTILFINSRFLKISFVKYLSHMLLSILPFILFAYFSHYLIFGLFHTSNTIIVFFFSGIIYSILSLISIFLFPVIFGLHKADLTYLKNKITFIILKK